MAKMLLTILVVCALWSNTQKAGGSSRIMELEGSNKELSDLWVVVINQRKNLIVNKQKEKSKEHHINSILRHG